MRRLILLLFICLPCYANYEFCMDEYQCRDFSEDLVTKVELHNSYLQVFLKNNYGHCLMYDNQKDALKDYTYFIKDYKEYNNSEKSFNQLFKEWDLR